MNKSTRTQKHEITSSVIKDMGIAVSTALAAGLIQGDNQQFLKSYAWDALFPVYFYFLGRGINSKLGKEFSPALYSVLGFGGASLAEIAQSVGLYPGTYDTKDFIAYGVGAVSAAILGKLTEKKSKLENKIESWLGEEK